MSKRNRPVRSSCGWGRAMVALLLLAAAFATVGCGGGQDGSATSGGAQAGLDRAEFLERGNAACRKIKAPLAQGVVDFERRTVGSRPRGELNADIAHYVILPEIEEEMEALRALPLFGHERVRVDRIIAIEEQALTEVVFEQRLGSVASIARWFAESGRMFRAYGLPACAYDLAL